MERVRYQITRCEYKNEDKDTYVHLRCFNLEKEVCGGLITLSEWEEESGETTHEPGTGI